MQMCFEACCNWAEDRGDIPPVAMEEVTCIGAGKSCSEQCRGWGRVGVAGRSAEMCYILFPFPRLIRQHGSTWTCASELAGTGPSRPIAEAGDFSRTREQMSFYLEGTSSMPYSYIGCSMAVLVLLRPLRLGLGSRSDKGFV